MDIQGNAEEEEFNNPDFHCEHGTFIGNPYGGDYLCHWCEDGISIEDYTSLIAERQARKNLYERALKTFHAGCAIAQREFGDNWPPEVKDALVIEARFLLDLKD